MSEQSKSAWRTAARAARRRLAGERDLAADDQALAAYGLATLRTIGIGEGATVTLYESRPVEPPTAGLITALRRAGHRVLLPITEPDLDLDWFDAADPSRTRLGPLAVAEVALAFLPGLNVDPDGTRMGQGGGCYDRVLPRLPDHAPRVVLLHPGEFRDTPIPRESHDQPVTHVLTADGLTPLHQTVHPTLHQPRGI